MSTQTSNQPQCSHNVWAIDTKIAYIKDSRHYMVDLRIQCQACGLPLVFLGLPVGCDTAGAAVSVDGRELRVAAKLEHTKNPTETIRVMLRQAPATPPGLPPTQLN